MKNSRNTKRALLASVMSLVLCVAMLIGTTFAWFTDSVTTGENTVQAGNLDVELQYATTTSTEENGNVVPSGWTDAEGVTDIFDANAFWEPGYTQVVYLKVINKGNLALKYQLGINVVDNTTGKTASGDTIDLSNYIKFGVVDGITSVYKDRAAARAAVAETAKVISDGYSSTEGHLQAGKESGMIALVVYMPEDVGNKANHGSAEGDVPEIDLGISLVATQDTVESDSYGNDYDENAAYPVMSAADLQPALSSGGIVTLGTDVTSDSALVVSGSVSLDLGANQITNKSGSTNGINLTGSGNNMSITATTGGVSMSNQHCIFVEASKSNITVDGGTYSVDGPTNAYLIADYYTSNGNNQVTIQNVTYTGNRGVQFSQSENNVINIKNCSFETNGFSTIYIGGGNNECNLEDVTVNGSQICATSEGSRINIKSGSYTCTIYANNGGVVSIAGGTYYGDLGTSSEGTISITGGSFSKEPTKYLAAGYTATLNSKTGMYDVTAAN